MWFFRIYRIRIVDPQYICNTGATMKDHNIFKLTKIYYFFCYNFFGNPQFRLIWQREIRSFSSNYWYEEYRKHFVILHSDPILSWLDLNLKKNIQIGIFTNIGSGFDFYQCRIRIVIVEISGSYSGFLFLNMLTLPLSLNSKFSSLSHSTGSLYPYALFLGSVTNDIYKR